jgi:cell filamentation protein
MDGFVDPYVDPATGILRNRVGARTRAELDRAEGAEFFLPVSMIDRAASFTAEELRADDALRGLDRGR